MTGFAEAFSGEIIRRDDPGYDEARVVWNGMIDRYPELVVRPVSAVDVVAAVRFAREEELPVADRLAALKRQWDPDNVFLLNQNIPPA